MKRLDLTPIALGALAVGLSISCGSDRDNGDDTSALPPQMTGVSGPSSGADGGEEDTGEKLDAGNASGGNGCAGDIGCTDQIDLLIVLDNSGTMGEEQLNLARNFPLLIERLENLTDSEGTPVNPDVQIMVTTTDFANPACAGSQPADYEPARGAPISTACTSRLGYFTNLTGDVSIPEACSDSCPTAVEPEGNFIAFSPLQDNIPDSVVPVDIDGDGDEDSPAAQALSCIGPQGINGCGYEAPLEIVLQALYSKAAWNDGPDGTNDEPFLRDGALLAIAIITDEADCSIQDFTIMSDETYHEYDPSEMMVRASSALCWNAGVECTGPDGDGVYAECHSTGDKMQPTSRYINFLVNQLREGQGKEVIMLGILGVPPVTARNPDPPFQPTAGGVFDLVYRDWVDGQYPGGDILPDEFTAGVTAADKQFDFGIGPGCTGTDANGDFTGQAIPPVRIKEVCEALNLDDTAAGTRCCIESICDDDFSPAIECLTGIIQETIKPQG